MIRFRILGKRVSMSEKQWAQLKQRFDEKNAVFITESCHPAYVDQRWVIEVSCQWCKKYGKKSCQGCVWNKFQTSHCVTLGCIRVLQTLLKEKYGTESYLLRLGSVVYLGLTVVMWTRGIDKEARQILRCIQKEFRIIEGRRRK